MGTRRRAREAALQILFAAESSQEILPEVIGEVHSSLIEQFSLAVRARERARTLAMGVACNRKTLDERIERACTHWRLRRLATVDRNILRIATYELLFEPEIPVEVILDEAVEIARRFSGSSSPAFVNGVLDVIASDRSSPPT